MDEFSRHIKTQFICEFPEWEKFCSTVVDGCEEVLTVKVPSESGEVTSVLRVDTFSGEVTVAFDTYHAHFFDFIHPKGNDALSFIKKLISDRCAVVSYWRDDMHCGSLLLNADEFPVSNEEYPYSNLIRFRSWLGTHNKEISCSHKD